MGNVNIQLPSNWTLSAFSDEAGISLDAQIDAARRAHLQFIDLRSLDGFNISAFPVQSARAAKAKLDDAGLKVQMFGSPLGKIDIADDFDSELQKLRHLSELAPLFNCRAVRVFSYFNDHGAPKGEWEAIALDRLTQLRDEAKALGLKLYHENERHIFGDLGRDVLKITALRDEHFATIFDFDNFNQSGEDVWATWELLRDVTDSIHLKDSTKDNQHVPVGQGNGQVERILRDAISRGWSGPLAVEPHLTHSAAVAATGPSGNQNEAFSAMLPVDSFHVAVETAQQMIARVSA